MNRRWNAWLGVVSLAGFGLLGACGGDDDDNGGAAGSGGQAGAVGGGGAGGAAGSGGATDDCTTADNCSKYKTDPTTAAQPPAAPATSPVSGATVVHAVDALFVGDTNRDGSPNPNAWKTYGFDLDGWTSTAGQGFHCQPQKAGTNKAIRDDGPGGIDNSFGRNIVLGLLTGFAPSPSQAVTDPLLQGSFSIVLKLENLGTTVSGTGLRTQLFAAAGTKDGGGLPVAPTDWATYQWHPFANAIEANGDSKVVFPDAYITNNVWVSGSGQAPVNLQVSVAGQALELAVQHPRLSLDLTDRTKGTKGNLGGILDTEQLIIALQKIAGNVDVKYCDPNAPAFLTIADQIRAASDILTDGTQDPSKPCNGISVGMGFTTRTSLLGDKADVTGKNPCTGAGGSN